MVYEARCESKNEVTYITITTFKKDFFLFFKNSKTNNKTYDAFRAVWSNSKSQHRSLVKDSKVFHKV